jgi:hypothetical protein
MLADGYAPPQETQMKIKVKWSLAINFLSLQLFIAGAVSGQNQMSSADIDTKVNFSYSKNDA